MENNDNKKLIEEFLKNGGKIQKIEEGKTSPNAVKNNRFVRKKDRNPTKGTE